MKTVETREFRANLAEMLKTAAKEPVLLDRGRKGLVLFGLALNPLKRLASSSNVLHMRDFRANLATYLDQVGEKLLFIRNADKVLLMIIEVPPQYVGDIRATNNQTIPTPFAVESQVRTEPDVSNIFGSLLG